MEVGPGQDPAQGEELGGARPHQTGAEGPKTPHRAVANLTRRSGHGGGGEGQRAGRDGVQGVPQGESPARRGAEPGEEAREAIGGEPGRDHHDGGAHPLLQRQPRRPGDGRRGASADALPGRRHQGEVHGGTELEREHRAKARRRGDSDQAAKDGRRREGHDVGARAEEYIRAGAGIRRVLRRRRQVLRVQRAPALTLVFNNTKILAFH